MESSEASKYYREYKPDLFWQSYIECFWEFHIAPEILNEANQIYLPDGSPQMIVVLDKNYERTFPDGRTEKISEPVLIPQRNSAVRINHEPGTRLFGIRFKPYGIRCVVHKPMSEFSEMSVPLTEILGVKDTNELRVALEEKDLNKKHLTVQKILTKHFEALPVNTKIIDIIKYISVNHGTSISELTKRFSLSQSSLEKLFNAYIGISAKSYMKIIRLNKSVKYYKNRSKHYPNLTATGAEAEFYDQSHFIKDFKQMSGITPGQYFRENNFFNIFLVSSIDEKTDI
ncbi:MAG: helix-turn-helix domain-containing protein [Candidatus Delongbacteria bacterium]|jgi:AraC-like DNA-binding protein|nr:helix-turn-helix domain-containing protein [Candidatus Delongbacteria bacterium]MDD4204699.1 helix-turn-helix domain-containing protein [Candidatus Delongbacteria bacterium]MDY0016901.1 helix-turn-helix domain-containing protein [Candidatus Delongbacteria bacterium]